jgi:hypothetical protein
MPFAEADSAGTHTSWATLREQLSTHQVVMVVSPASNGDVLKIRKSSTPEAHHKAIYDTLKISPDLATSAKEIRDVEQSGHGASGQPPLHTAEGRQNLLASVLASSVSDDDPIVPAGGMDSVATT